MIELKYSGPVDICASAGLRRKLINQRDRYNLQTCVNNRFISDELHEWIDCALIHLWQSMIPLVETWQAGHALSSNTKHCISTWYARHLIHHVPCSLGLAFF
jgi:hypothetical protein